MSGAQPMSEASALGRACPATRCLWSALGRVARIQQIGKDAGHCAFSAVDLSQVRQTPEL
jgi:hypothetical protein